jgi:hypothetical protein
MATAKVTTVTDKSDDIVEEKEIETPETEVTEVSENDKLIAQLSSNPILADFTKKYLDVHGEISQYNAEVLAAKDSEWNPGKVMTKATEFAKPEPNSGVKADEEILSLMQSYEKLLIEVARAKKSVVDATAKKLGITLSATAERDPVKEEALKEKRSVGVVLGKRLNDIAEMFSDKEMSDAIAKFLTNNPLPAVGRQSSMSFAGNEGKATPKYRVKVEVYKGDEKLDEFDGFSKTALSLSNSKFGYERGKALKADKFREAWEAPGNNSEKTVQSTVEFTDNGLRFVLTKK